MYCVGDWVFYGNIGVCQVINIDERQITGIDRKHMYYTLRPLSGDCSISAPTDSIKVFMRPIISKEEAMELIDNIPNIAAEPCYEGVRQLSEHYEAVLNTHSCMALIEMTKSIYMKRDEAIAQKKKLGAVDEKFMKRAEDLLFGELSVALGLEKKQVKDCIAQKMERYE